MIRPVSRMDLMALLNLGERMHAKSKYSHVPYDAMRAATVVQGYIENPDLFAWITEARDGFLFGYLRPFFFSERAEAVDALWYVEGNGRAALSLLRKFEEWAHENDAVGVRIESGAGIDDRADRLLKRLGYEYLGGNHFKGL